MSPSQSHTKADDGAKSTDAKAPSADAPAQPAAATAADAAGRTDGGGAVTGTAVAAVAEPAAADVEAAAAPSEATLFGALDAEERIRVSTQPGERTLWASALLVTLLYASLIAGHVLLGAPFAQDAAERERLRRGQDAPPSISVELVPDPDKTSKTTRWREGEAQATPTPNEAPPQQPQMASIAQPEVPEAEAKEEPQEKTEERPEGSPMLLDIESLVDAAAADLTQKIDRAFSKKPQKERRQQQAVMAGGGMQVRGTGASGKSDAFSRSVIAALMKTRPGPFALWGRVLVSFEISPSGTLNYVHLLHSSGNTALDQAAINAIHKARFEAPPPGLSAQERTYIIDYVFG